MKKLISAFTALVISVTCLILPVSAGDASVVYTSGGVTHYKSADQNWWYHSTENENEIYVEGPVSLSGRNVINIPESIDGKTVVGAYAFDDASMSVKYKLVIPDTLRYYNVTPSMADSMIPFVYNGVEEYSVSGGNKYFASKNGVLYSKDMKTLVAYPQQSAKKKYIMPKTVEYYPAFAYCSSLEEITFSGKIKAIKENSFYKCKNLKKIKLGGGVKRINSNAFNGLKKLKTINMPKSLEKIGQSAFGNCKSLSKVTFNSKKKAPKIGKSAFKGTKKGIKFYVKNKKVAKSLKKQLKNSGAKSARIIIK